MDSIAKLSDAYAKLQKQLYETRCTLEKQAQEQSEENVRIQRRLKSVMQREMGASEIDRIKGENEYLRKRIKTLSSDPWHSDNPDPDPDPEIDAHEKSFTEIRQKRDPSRVLKNYQKLSSGDRIHVEDYARLAKRYKEVYSEGTSLFKAYFTARRRLRLCVKRVKEWNQLFEQRSFKVTVLGETVGFQRVNQECLTGREARSPSLPPIGSRAARSEENVERKKDDDQGPVLDSEPISTQSQDPRYAAVQSFPPLEPSSDTPMVVSERPVRKRGAERRSTLAPTVYQNPESGEHSHPIKVKSEPSSDSPQSIERINADINLRESHSPDPAPSPTLTGRVNPSGKLPVSKDRDYASVSTPTNGSKTTERANLQSTERKRSWPALRSVDHNITPVHQTTKDLSEPQPKRRRRGSGAAAVPSIAEDGEESIKRRRSLRLVASNTATTKSPRPQTHNHNRLQNLLETESTPRATATPSPKHSKHVTPNTIKGKTNRLSKVSAMEQWVSGGGNSNNTTPKATKAIRNHPIEQLNIEDFKLNPARNEGLDYAFTDVIRDKSARKQLRGCLEDKCCGPIFRRMARDEIGNQPYPFSALNAKQMELLDEELGGRSRRALQNAPGKDIRNLLVEAQARAFSNQFSRHRTSHGRARSPPGYWRTEMPSTQEVEQDRELAGTLERKKVIERYNEAMKDNGLWKFADE